MPRFRFLKSQMFSLHSFNPFWSKFSGISALTYRQSGHSGLLWAHQLSPAEDKFKQKQVTAVNWGSTEQDFLSKWLVSFWALWWRNNGTSPLLPNHPFSFTWKSQRRRKCKTVPCALYRLICEHYEAWQSKFFEVKLLSSCLPYCWSNTYSFLLLVKFTFQQSLAKRARSRPNAVETPGLC